MEAKPHPRTTKQALAEQKIIADRDREARLAAGRKAVAHQHGAVDVKPQEQSAAPSSSLGKTDVALPDTRTPQQAYLDEIAPPSSLVGRPIKFDGKAGKWLFSDTDEEIGPNTDFIALCDEILIGWIKFNGKGEQPDRIQGLLYDGFIMPPQSTLPDRDPSKWELGLSGEPDDPWQHQMCLVLQSPGTHELGTFATTLAHRTASCRQPAAALRSHAQERRRSLPRRPAQGLRLQPQRRASWLGAHAGLCRCRQGRRRHPPLSPTRRLVGDLERRHSRSEERSARHAARANAAPCFDSRKAKVAIARQEAIREIMRAWTLSSILSPDGHPALCPPDHIA